MKLSKLTRGVCTALLLAAPMWIAGCSEKQSVIGYYNADRIEREAGQIKALQDEATTKLKEKQAELETKMNEKQAALEENFKKKQDEIAAKFQAKEDEFNQKVQANPPTSQEEADKLQAEADELGQTLQKEAEEDMQKLQAEASAEAQRIQQEASLQMQGLRAQYQNRMTQKLDAAVDEIAKAKKIDVVLDNSSFQKSVIYGGVDITEDLLEKLK